MLIATGLLLVVSSIVTSALLQMTKQQQTIWNRTEMHSGVRGATELLQQEVGQAGRITLPAQRSRSDAAPSPAGTPARARWQRRRWHRPVHRRSLERHVVDAASDTGISSTFLDGDNTETVRSRR